MTFPDMIRMDIARMMGRSGIALIITLSSTHLAVAQSESDAFTPPLENLTGFAERPLFNSSRRPIEHAPTPDAEPQQPVTEPLAATLFGVTATSEGYGLAILKLAGQNKLQRVRIGESVNGWQLDRIEPHSAIFTNNGDSTILSLPLKSGDLVPTIDNEPQSQPLSNDPSLSEPQPDPGANPDQQNDGLAVPPGHEAAPVMPNVPPVSDQP